MFSELLLYLSGFLLGILLSVYSLFVMRESALRSILIPVSGFLVGFFGIDLVLLAFNL